MRRFSVLLALALTSLSPASLCLPASAQDTRPFWDRPDTPARPPRRTPGDAANPLNPRDLGLPDPASRPSPQTRPADPELAAKIDKLVNYYLELFEPALKNTDWITRAIAIISLSRMDDPRITDRLLGVLEKDQSNIVRIYAWEALHARNPSLTDSQRARWTAGGVKLVCSDALKGDLRVGFVQLIAGATLTADVQKAFMQLFKTTNLQSPGDEQVLLAMRQAVAGWRNPAIIKALVAEMGVLDNTHRADFLLSGLDAEIPSGRWLEMNVDSKETTVGGVKWVTMERKGSKVAWAQTSAAWTKWLGDPKTAPKPADNLAPYLGRSIFIPAAARIVDPDDKVWRKDLEIPKFQLDRFDFGFVVDSTESMTFTIEWVKKNVVRVMWALQAVCREPRMGVTLYRDHSTPQFKEEYLVKCTPLMASGERLAEAILSANAAGGGDIPEAVYEAIDETLRKQDWSKNASTKKVIVLIGDAPPHAETMDKLKKLVEGATAGGFRFCCVKVHSPQQTVAVTQEYNGERCDVDKSFDLIAQWGKGESIELDATRMSYTNFSALARLGMMPGQERLLVSRERLLAERERLLADRGLRPEPNDATDPYCTAKNNDPYCRIVGAALRSVLKEAYYDRVPPFVNVLLELVDPPGEPEKHQLVEAMSRRVQVPNAPIERPAPVRPVPPQPVPVPQFERVYYIVGNQTLGMVTFQLNPRRALSAEILTEFQGQLRWQTAQPNEVTAGRKITDEEAAQFQTNLMEGRKPPGK